MNDEHSYTENRLLSGILYFQSIAERRKVKVFRSPELFEKLCGNDPLKSVIFVTSMWNTVIAEWGEAREQELMEDQDVFKPLLDQGATFARYNNKQVSAIQIILSLLSKKTGQERPATQTEMVDDRLLPDETIVPTLMTHDFDNLIDFLQNQIKEEESSTIHYDPDNKIRTEQKIQKMRNEIAEMEGRKRTIGKGRPSIPLYKRLTRWLKQGWTTQGNLNHMIRSLEMIAFNSSSALVQLEYGSEQLLRELTLDIIDDKKLLIDSQGEQFTY
jgi:hypothetical protein